MASFDLTVVWACFIGFAVFAYVVMDGFDLGIGCGGGVGHATPPGRPTACAGAELIPRAKPTAITAAAQ